MTSLEFIDQEIEKLEDCLMIVKANGALKYKLKYFKQIKTELEAWEIVKKYGVAYLKEKNYLELSLIYANCPENKNYQKLKKALEVKDESRDS